MAIFKKPESFSELVKKLENPSRFGPGELGEIIASATTHQEASPRRLAFMMTSTHPRVREAGMRYVVDNAPRDATDVMIQAMASLEGSARTEIGRAVLGMDRRNLLEAANTLFNSGNTSIRMAVIELASLDRDWRDWFGLMKQGLKSTESPLRRAAARLIRRHMQDPIACTVMKDLLHDDDSAVRSEAIQGFCDFPRAEIVEPFFARLPHESPVDQTRMIQALARLGSRPDSNIEVHLFPILADDDPQARNLAVRLISAMPAPAAVLRKFLVHCRGLASWLRERAVRSMLEVAGALTEPILELMRDPDEDVRVSAMGLAAKIRDERIFEPVTRIFCSNADWWIRSLAAEILSNFPKDETLELLLPYLHDTDMRFSIVSALARIERPETTAHLVECLHDPARSIRGIAIDGLEGRKSEEVVDALLRLARTDEDAALRAKAIEVLRRLGPISSGRLRALEIEMQAREDAEQTAKREASIAGLDLQMENPELNRR
jgi:HEAT repeat protein